MLYVFCCYTILVYLQFIEISNQTSKKSTVIGNIYRPPKSKNEPLHTFITEFTNILSSIQNKNLLHTSVVITT